VAVLLGPPGSGKGTQCERLSAMLQIPHISTGDTLRKYSRDGSNLAQQVKNFIDTGILVPDSLVMNMPEERTRQTDCCRGFSR